MQGDQERPPASGRPSLLSSAPPPEAGRAGILDGLERRPGTAAARKPAGKAASKKVALAGGLLALLVLAGGAALWMNAGPEPQLTLPSAAQAITPAPDAAVAAAPPAEAPTPAPTPAPAPAAAIVEETAAVSPPADSRSLKDVLNDTPAKPVAAPALAHEGSPGELRAALEKPHAAPAKPKPQQPKKPVQLAKKAETKPKPKATPQDNDVALLAALMAHVQSAKPAKETSTPGYQLKQCGRMNEAGAAQCRAHLCAGAARKEPECKQQPVAVKTAAES